MTNYTDVVALIGRNDSPHILLFKVRIEPEMLVRNLPENPAAKVAEVAPNSREKLATDAAKVHRFFALEAEANVAFKIGLREGENLGNVGHDAASTGCLEFSPLKS